MPAWILFLIQALPTIINIIKEILALIKRQPLAAQELYKADLFDALKTKRFDKLHDILEKLRA